MGHNTVSSEGKLSLFFDYSVSAYVLQVKVEMEMEIQQYEKAKAVREEQLDRLTQICQEQAVRPPLSHLRASDVPVVTEAGSMHRVFPENDPLRAFWFPYSKTRQNNMMFSALQVHAAADDSPHVQATVNSFI